MSNRTIYIVDDNVEFLESTRFWLSGAGFEVKTCSDPREAIETLAQRDRGEPACLMLDVRMPQLSGLDVHDALHERGAQLPVIYAGTRHRWRRPCARRGDDAGVAERVHWRRPSSPLSANRCRASPPQR
jgi:CheY-like chemotaxis protein